MSLSNDSVARFSVNLLVALLMFKAPGSSVIDVVRSVSLACERAQSRVLGALLSASRTIARRTRRKKRLRSRIRSRKRLSPSRCI